MKRSTKNTARLAAVVTAIGTGAVATFALPSSGAAAPKPGHALYLTAAASTNSMLYIPCSKCIRFSQPKGAHLGGTEVDSGRLFDRSGKTVGHYALVSIGVTPFGTAGPGELQQTATLVIGSSQITAQGLEEPPLSAGTYAITGGTGHYRGVRGEIRATDNPNGSTNLTINLDR